MTMKTRVTTLTLVLSMAFLNLFCSRRENEKLRFDCEGQTLSIRNVDETQYIINSRSFNEVWFNDKRVATVYNMTVHHGPPYKADVYGSSPYHFFADIDSTQRGMLCIDPSGCSVTDFPKLAHCMETHRQAIEQALIYQESDSAGPGSSSLYPQTLGGIVLGENDDFVQRYQNDQSTIEIYADGEVRHQQKGNGTMVTSTEGLPQRILPPGTQLILTDTRQMPLERLRAYRHTKTGHSIATDFMVVVDEKGQAGEKAAR